MKTLVHIHSGPEQPDKITLGALIAAVSAERGDEVTLFFASNAVHALASGTRETLEGVGFGALSDSLARFRAAGGRLVVSRLSSESRGYDDGFLPETAAWGTPEMLLDIAGAADATLCY
ncbi:DsrE family protein [Tropicimonas sp. S265A]|uniref:DsrE family protein n=1 Tax=Tropicimonas sp. S265A TaxID=3415134 RepID=UPI003C798FB1